MGNIDSRATTSGGVPEARSRAWTHLKVDRRSPSYWRITFDHPPINTITATTVAELAELVGLIEEDPDLNVVVFDSANPDFYLAHYDVENDPGKTAALGAGPTGLPAWLDLLARLSRASAVSIASIRGRARGAGSEFILACDMRFASRENTSAGVSRNRVSSRSSSRGKAGLPRRPDMALHRDAVEVRTFGEQQVPGRGAGRDLHSCARVHMIRAPLRDRVCPIAVRVERRPEHPCHGSFVTEQQRHRRTHAPARSRSQVRVAGECAAQFPTHG